MLFRSEATTNKLITGLLAAAHETGHAATGGNISAMFGMFFTDRSVHNFADAKQADTDKFSRFHRGMLEAGVYLAPSQYEAGFSSLAHTDVDIDQTIAAARQVLSNL